MYSFLRLVVLLCCFWLLLSGMYEPFLMCLGFVSALFVAFIVSRMNSVDHDSEPIYLQIKLIRYIVWLAWEIIMSNIYVVRRIWSAELIIDPMIASRAISLKTTLGKVIFANSITLTPGTVTFGLDGSNIVVHALTSELIDELFTGEMERRILELEE